MQYRQAIDRHMHKRNGGVYSVVNARWYGGPNATIYYAEPKERFSADFPWIVTLGSVIHHFQNEQTLKQTLRSKGCPVSKARYWLSERTRPPHRPLAP
jgi:hypothetical protein